MSGRWYVWFLDEGLSTVRSRQHKVDVEADIRRSTWRAILTIAVDFRLWEGGTKFQSRFTTFKNGWYGKQQPHWRHFGEISGHTQFLFEKENKKFLRVIIQYPSDVIDIPIEAVVSYCSAGFPKVAYSVDQYLNGYLGWLDAFDAFSTGDHHLLISLQNQLLEENFSSAVFQAIQNLFTRCVIEKSLNPNSLRKELNDLIYLMTFQMEQHVPERCKPPYHHVIEWYVDKELLKRKHPIIETYLRLRTKFPSIVVK